MKRLSRTSFRLSAKEAEKAKGSEAGHQHHSSSSATSSPPAAMRDLKEFLAEAELSEYHAPLASRLKVSTLEHLKYVKEEDLEDIGMTKPEMRRLKKFYRKEVPQGTFNKLRKAIMRGGGDGRTQSPPPPEQRSAHHPAPAGSPVPIARPPGRQLIPSEAVALRQVLGEGEFGEVLQAVWTTEAGDKVQVAVKKLRRERVNTGSQNFLKEAAITQDVDHDHVVRLYGVVLDQEENIMLVTELAPMRSLLECLKDVSMRTDLSLPRLCDFAQQVCEGMSYLETKRLVHRDLAARNILVFSKNLVKISDLGLSRILGSGQDYYQSSHTASLKLPIAWLAPECINFLKFTSASDVWAFGVTLWEFFTYGFQPWPGMNGQQVLEAIEEPSCQRLEQPDLCTPELYALMKSCWADNPDQRPSFSALLVQLPQLRPTQVKATKDYPDVVLEKGYIYYKTGDVIVVIDKMPATSGPPGLVWQGVTASGKSGLFDPTSVVPFIEPKISPVALKGTSLSRKESGRKASRKIRADMISRPQNDLRHTGHIGYDGAVFGDVSFIGDNYDKLPVKVEGGSSRGTSMASLTPDSPDARNGHHRITNSNDSLDDPATNGIGGHSWISRESLSSQTTNQSEMDGSSYLDVEDDSLFADFKMPDLGSTFDFGPSFMDEVLKALDEKEKQVASSSGQAPAADAPPPADHDRDMPPVPAPRDSAKSSGIPPLPSHPPRVDPPKEKKQAKVKPMSASDEKIIDLFMAKARELTPLKTTMESPPVSPTTEKSHGFNDESPGFVAKLRNSLRRSTSPKSDRKRTFSDGLESKGDLEDAVTPEAQQAYNVLVVKGESDGRYNGRKESSGRDLGAQHHLHHQHFATPESGALRDPPHHGSSGGQPRISSPIVISAPQSSLSGKRDTPSPPILAPKPVISPPQLQNKPVAIAHPAPVPAPRPAKPDPSASKKSEIPVAKPRPEIQRVEPTIRQTMPESPEIEPKADRRIESHPFSRKESGPPAKDKDREDFKKTIEIVRVDDSSSFRDELSSERASTSFDRSSARSSQRSSLDRSDATSENAESERADWEHSECSSDSSKVGGGRDADPRANTSFGSGEQRDSFSKKQQPSSLFEEDVSEPSPQEIMSRLRERRLNRQIDHQRVAAGGGGENEPAAAVVPSSSSSSRPRAANAREPQGIPGRTPSVDLDDGGGDGSQEVDTNPLRMLRGGAIPIRSAGRGTSGMTLSAANPGKRGAGKALRVPSLNFSSPLCRQTTSPTTAATADNDSPCPSTDGHDHHHHHPLQTSSSSSSSWSSSSGSTTTTMTIAPDGQPCHHRHPTPVESSPSPPRPPPSASRDEDKLGAAAELAEEIDKLTMTLMEGDLTEVANAVTGGATPAQEEVRKFTERGLRLDFGKSLPPPYEGGAGSSGGGPLPTYFDNGRCCYCPASSPQSAGGAGGAKEGVATFSISAAAVATIPSAATPKPKAVVAPSTAAARPSSSPSPLRSQTAETVDSLALFPVGTADTTTTTSTTAARVAAAAAAAPSVEAHPRPPPRLPPRRSQSLSDNPDSDRLGPEDVPDAIWAARQFRRSSSLEEADIKPPLPPRDPQKGPHPPPPPFPPPPHIPPRIAVTQARNYHSHASPPPAPKRITPSKHPPPFMRAISSPSSHPHRQPSRSPRAAYPLKKMLSQPEPAVARYDAPPSSKSASPQRPRQPAGVSPTRSSPRHRRLPDSQSPAPVPAQTSSSRQPSPRAHSPSGGSFGTSPLSQPDWVELPPALDLSLSSSDSSGDEGVDSEPTHVLLDALPSHKSVPPLVVSLPPPASASSSRLAVGGPEPTHIPLSWSDATLASSFSTGHPRGRHFELAPGAHSQGRRPPPKSFVRSVSHTFGQSAAPARGQYPGGGHAPFPSSSVSLSPPADLPPAPPAPSYRDRLRPKINRSVSLNRAEENVVSPCRSLDLTDGGPSHPGTSGHGSGRRRSSSTTSARTHSDFERQHQEQPGISSTSQSKSPQAPHHVFRYPTGAWDRDDGEMGDDDAFFSEAPSTPYPYSQSPFHPIVTTTSAVPSSGPVPGVSHHQPPTPSLPSNATTTTTTPSYSHSHYAPPPRPAPFVGLRVTTARNSDVPPPISPRTTSRLSYSPDSPVHTPTPALTAATLHPTTSPPRLTPRLGSKCATEIRHSPTTSLSPPQPPPLTPRSSSKSFMQIHPRPHTSGSSSSTSSSPTHTPLPMPKSPPSTVASPFPSSSSHHQQRFSYSPESCRRSRDSTATRAAFGSVVYRGPTPATPLQSQPQPLPPSLSSAAAPHYSFSKSSQPHWSSRREDSATLGRSPPSDLGSLEGYPSGGEEVSPVMLSSYKYSSSVSYEDLMLFDADRQKNCEEIEALLEVFQNEVTVEECTQALEVTRWDVAKAVKYLQLKSLLSTGLADVRTCRDALAAWGWDVERAAESLLESQQQQQQQQQLQQHQQLQPSSLSSCSSSSSSHPTSSPSSSSSPPSPSTSLSSSVRASPARGTGHSAPASVLQLPQHHRLSTTPGDAHRPGGGGGGGEEGELSSSSSFSSSTSGMTSVSGLSNYQQQQRQRPPSPETVDV